MGKDQTTRICLCASPRNISTALMYSFAQRSDTRVVDEPFYGFYLSHTKAREYHPGAEEIISSMNTDGDEIIREILGPHSKPVVFYKNMTHHMLDLDMSFTREAVNIILTRDPIEMINSFSKVVDKPNMKDVGYQDQVDLLDYLKKSDAAYLVIDARDILLNPEKALSLICERAGIEFEKTMLSWEAGAREEDGVWAKYWYDNVHKSTGFAAYKDRSVQISYELKILATKCQSLYDYLSQHFETS
ncbi:MAG: sulfotransferase family protein [Cyclobacteriaceae bacterium]|nr:sulfotransferase family protein [Cyclobacteriaceae bacterium SS2]